MLNSNNYSTFSGIPLETASQALSRAEGLVFSVLGHISEKEYTETYNGNNEQYLVLKHSPVVSVQAITGDIEYFIQDGGILAIPSLVPRGFNNMTVTYTAGYTEETIPSDLKYAIYDIANKIANAGDSWNSNVSKEHIDGASIEWKSLDIMNSMNIILSYKKVAV